MLEFVIKRHMTTFYAMIFKLMAKFATQFSLRQANGMKHLDRIDEKILSILQTNNQLTCHEMAELVSISPSSCRRRMEALRRNGTIIADVSIIHPEVYGESLSIVALVTLERDTPDVHAAFRRAMQNLPQVLDCEYVAGHCDYVVRFKLASMAQYDALSDQYFTADPAIKRVDSLVVMKSIKTRPELGIPRSAAL